MVTDLELLDYFRSRLCWLLWLQQYLRCWVVTVVTTQQRAISRYIYSKPWGVLKPDAYEIGHLIRIWFKYVEVVFTGLILGFHISTSG